MPEIVHSLLAYAIPGQDSDAVRLHSVIVDDVEQAMIETMTEAGQPTAGVRLSKRQLLMVAQAAAALANQLPD
jgi:hypothetical protein